MPNQRRRRGKRGDLQQYEQNQIPDGINKGASTVRTYNTSSARMVTGSHEQMENLSVVQRHNQSDGRPLRLPPWQNASHAQPSKPLTRVFSNKSAGRIPNPSGQLIPSLWTQRLPNVHTGRMTNPIDWRVPNAVFQNSQFQNPFQGQMSNSLLGEKPNSLLGEIPVQMGMQFSQTGPVKRLTNTVVTGQNYGHVPRHRWESPSFRPVVPMTWGLPTRPQPPFQNQSGRMPYPRQTGGRKPKGNRYPAPTVINTPNRLPKIVITKEMEEEVFKMNSTYVKTQDADFQFTLEQSPQAAIFCYKNPEGWVEPEAAGCLILYERLSSPRVGFIIFNRLAVPNWNHCFNPKSIEIQIQNNYLLFKDGPEIFCLWFYKDNEAARFGNVLERFGSTVTQPNVLVSGGADSSTVTCQ